MNKATVQLKIYICLFYGIYSFLFKVILNAEIFFLNRTQQSIKTANGQIFGFVVTNSSHWLQNICKGSFYCIWFLHKFKIFRFIKFNGKLTKASSTKATVQSDGQRPECQPHDWWFFITLLEDLSLSERQIWVFLVVVYIYIGVMYSWVRGEICRCRKHSRPDQK